MWSLQFCFRFPIWSVNMIYCTISQTYRWNTMCQDVFFHKNVWSLCILSHLLLSHTSPDDENSWTRQYNFCSTILVSTPAFHTGQWSYFGGTQITQEIQHQFFPVVLEILFQLFTLLIKLEKSSVSLLVPSKLR